MTQSRNIYVTGDSELDRILNDIAARLDVIEGLRPDLDTGYYNLDAAKSINTSDLSGDFIEAVDNVSIGTGSITVTAVSGNSIVITGDSVNISAAAGNSIAITGTSIKINDENGALIFEIGSFTI